MFLIAMLGMKPEGIFPINCCLGARHSAYREMGMESMDGVTFTATELLGNSVSLWIQLYLLRKCD